MERSDTNRQISTSSSFMKKIKSAFDIWSSTGGNESVPTPVHKLNYYLWICRVVSPSNNFWAAQTLVHCLGAMLVNFYVCLSVKRDKCQISQIFFLTDWQAKVKKKKKKKCCYVYNMWISCDLCVCVYENTFLLTIFILGCSTSRNFLPLWSGSMHWQMYMYSVPDCDVSLFVIVMT